MKKRKNAKTSSNFSAKNTDRQSASSISTIPKNYVAEPTLQPLAISAFSASPKKSSIAGGVRRIEAVTGKEAEALSRQSEDCLLKIAQTLKSTPPQLPEKIENLLEEMRGLEMELKNLRRNQTAQLIESLLSQTSQSTSVRCIIAEVSQAPEALQETVDLALEKLGSGIVMLGAALPNRCQIIAKVSDDLVKQGFSAHALIQLAMPIVEGKGGGKPLLAQGGGKASHKLLEALEIVKEHLAGRSGTDH